MKMQRSRFRLIAFVLLAMFFLVAFLCARRVGLIRLSASEVTQEGNPAAVEESLTETAIPPDLDLTTISPPPESDFDVYGL